MTSRFLFLLLTLSAACAAPAPKSDDIPFGKRVTLKSQVLGEECALKIFTPHNYTSDKGSYPVLPVLYVLDGPWQYTHVTGLVDFLANTNRLPPMIVVAVANKDRTRDLTPTRSLLGPDGKKSDGFPLDSSGGSANFLRFLRDELIPYIDQNYRTAPFRILDGHSFGGLFGTRVLLESPGTFQAYILISPSYWWDGEVIANSTGPIGAAKQFVYLTVGNEGGRHRAAIDRFAQQLKQRAAPGLAWRYKPYEDESHVSVHHISMYDGLSFIFNGWDFEDVTDEAEPPTYEQAVAHYAKLSEKFGYTVKLPLARIQSVADAYGFRHRWAEAVAVHQHAIVAYPTSALAHSGLGAACAIKGDRAAAIQHYQRALEIAPKNENIKRALAKLQDEAKAL